MYSTDSPDLVLFLGFDALPERDFLSGFKIWSESRIWFQIQVSLEVKTWKKLSHMTCSWVIWLFGSQACHGFESRSRRSLLRLSPFPVILLSYLWRHTSPLETFVSCWWIGVHALMTLFCMVCLICACLFKFHVFCSCNICPISFAVFFFFLTLLLTSSIQKSCWEDQAGGLDWEDWPWHTGIFAAP